MKGPGMRLDLDVRRVWQCPSCGAEIRLEGRVVSKSCTCARDGVSMRLVELPRPKPVPRPIKPPEPESEIPELADFPTDIPVNPRLSNPTSGEIYVNEVPLADGPETAPTNEEAENTENTEGEGGGDAPIGNSE